MNPLQILNYDIIPNLIFAQAAPLGSGLDGLDATTGANVGGTETGVGDNAANAGRVVRNLLESVNWLSPMLSAVGAVLFLYLVLKFVWDRRKGGQGGGGGQAGQVVGAMAALAVFFVPGVIAIAADLVINGVISVINFATDLLT